MKNIKHLKIGRTLTRMPVARPENYVYERPERIRASFAERLIAGFQRYRPDIQMRMKGPGICFYQYKIKILPGESRYNNSVHKFQNTKEFLEDLVENNIIDLTLSDIAYISKFIDKN